MQQETVNVFIAYSRKDAEIKDRLKTALKVLQRVGHIDSIWDDSAIEAGAEWERAIHNHLDSSDIILLLVSHDFLASDYCFGTEMSKALKAHEEEKAKVIPIIVRHCSWNITELEKFQALPENGKPIVEKWDTEDIPYYQIEKSLTTISNDIREQKQVNKIKKEFDKIAKKAEDFYYEEKWDNAIKGYEQALKNYIENKNFLPSKEEIENKVKDCNLNIDIANKVLTLKYLLEVEIYAAALKELQEITTLEEKRRLVKVRVVWGASYCKLAVQIGDIIKKDDRLGIISDTEYKALGFLTSPVNGYVRKILFSEGELINNGKILFIIEKEIMKEQPKHKSYRDNTFTYG